jgi:hypothetical protein
MITAEILYFYLAIFISLGVLRDSGIAILHDKVINKALCFFLGIKGLVS